MDFPAALQSAQAWVQEVDGVEAVGETTQDGQKCIYVYITQPEAASKIPSEFYNYRVVVQQGPPIQAQ
jgi:hypothetical protein